MSVKLKYTTLSAVFLLLAITTSLAHSAEVASAMSLCDANPACTHSAPNQAGSVIFKLKLSTQTKTVLCDGDGKCVVFLPRGQRMTIKDISSVLLAKSD